MLRQVQKASPVHAAVACVLAALALLALAGPAGAVLSGKNGRIAFTSGRTAGDNTAQIFLKRPLAGPAGALGPAVTPLGGRSLHASWSPDRTKIVFANGTPGAPTAEEYDLFVKDFVANTITPLDLTQVGDGLSSDHPAWSPDGTRIAYEQQPTDNSAERDIKVKTVGTSAPAANLTTGAPVEFKPAWSPDSQTIYYASTKPSPQFLDIVKKPAGGGTETNVQAASGIDEYQPSISPDGSKLCFTLQSPGDSSTAEIYVTPLSGMGILTNISNDNTKGDINCTWSPDGTKIAYANGTFGGARLVMKNVADPAAAPTELANDDGDNDFDGNPDWAPDGRPVCPDSTVTTTVNRPVTISLECTDTGPAYERTPVRETNDTNPTRGTVGQVTVGDPSTITYTPNAGFAGTDSFLVRGFGDFGFGDDTGRVTINVQAPGGGNVINGTPGNDTINGTPGDDVINCGAGDDVVNAGGGDDVINCGAGNDRVDGGTGNDTINGDADNDQVSGGDGNDTVSGNDGNDQVGGGSGNDRVRGGSGNDRVNGNTGRDRINGDSGNDRVGGDSGNDRAGGGSGNDRVSGGSGRDRIAGGRGNDRVRGNSGNDRVAGDSGNDRVSGDSGRDRLSGGSGRDRLDGGRSRDRCDGGRGRDRARRCERRRRIP